MNRKLSKILTGVLLVALIVTATLCFTLQDVSSDDISDAAVIRQGMTGTTVRTIQTKLKNWGYYSGNVDGIYGSQTTAAVKRFQQKNGLVVDGIVGNKTAAKIGISLGGTSSGNSGYSGSDEYLLAKCIHAEARGEPYTGKVAVGAVVLNRVRSSKFPNSIAGVIYEPWAFTAVHDGQINLEPNEEAKRAARDALNGWDPTNGCIYYYNPATATSSWIWSRQVRLTIGKHRFAV